MEMTETFFGAFGLPSNILTMTSLQELEGWEDLSPRLKICLKTAGIESVKDLLEYGDYNALTSLDQRVATIPGVNNEVARELISYLERLGFTGALYARH